MKRLKTKIICTLGPACQSTETLRFMMTAGMAVARLNFSHGNHAEHQQSIDIIRKLNKGRKYPVKILQDLEGYRIRIGKLTGKQKLGIELKKGQMVLLSNQEQLSDKNIIPFDYQGLLSDIGSGSFIYIDDGSIAMRVKSNSRSILRTEVVVAGTVKEHKGINIPNIKLKFKDLTEKDKHDLQFGLKNRVDFIAQSFVRNKQDMLNIRSYIKDYDHHCPLIAKIENRDGIKNIDQILEVCDGIMVARGDMGVSLPIYEVPLLQKMIIKKCNQKKKFVITATQMLESMAENLRPTRAEVSDVANAILDGTDYVMLSGETAIGKYPVETVGMMSQIIKYTENHSADNPLR